MPTWNTSDWGGLPVMLTVMAVFFGGLAVYVLWVIVQGNKHDVRLQGELPGTNSQQKEQQTAARRAARAARQSDEQTAAAGSTD